LFLLVVFVALAINAFLCGALSSSDGRYQSRMMPLMMVGLFVAINDLWLATAPCASLSRLKLRIR
jgi:hypothetical protein